MRPPISALSFPQNGSTTTSSSATITPVPGTPVSQTSVVTKRNTRRAPLVYPALLSRVAEALLHRLPLSVRAKDGLSYADAFDGREAVDKICYIIKTTDRSLALLLGRALDAQKFFHDVTYDHRLRDNSNELYQFRISVGGLGLTGGNDPNAAIMGHTRGDSRSLSPNTSFSGSSHRPSMSRGSNHESGSNGRHYHPATDSTVTPLSGMSTTSHSQSNAPDEFNSGVNGEHIQNTAVDLDLPTGVFTILTECYSATCSRDQLCYSITCPRRLEQQARQNRPGSPNGRSVTGQSRVGRRATIGGSNPVTGSAGTNGPWSGAASPSGSGSGHGHVQGTTPKSGKEAIEDDDDAAVETGQLWIHSVPKEVADTLSDVEKRRQEAINEVVYTERDFVRDMEYLRDVWVAGIRNSDAIPLERRDSFISQVFWNLLAIIDVNTRLRDALSKRQKQYTVVGEIGDIFKEIVPLFDPFVEYGAHQMYGKYEFEKEKNNNPVFAEFVDVCTWISLPSLLRLTIIFTGNRASPRLTETRVERISHKTYNTPGPLPSLIGGSSQAHAGLFTRQTRLTGGRPYRAWVLEPRQSEIRRSGK
jgi:RHO1 GDP-GTP exchange protein 1/2